MGSRLRRLSNFLRKDIVEVNVVRYKKRQLINEEIVANATIIERESKRIVPIGGSLHVSQPESWLVKINDGSIKDDEGKILVNVKTELIKISEDNSFAILIRKGEHVESKSKDDQGER